jgi:CheY-like chemotaxis protein
MRSERIRPHHVLVAERSPSISRLIVRAVDAASIPTLCTIAESGRDAVRTMMDGHVDLAFVDANMPGLDWADAVARSRQGAGRTFFVVTSEHISKAAARTARDLMVYEFLAKPFASDRVDTVLDNYRRMRTRTSVLLVDDSSTTRSVIRRVLRSSLFALGIEDASSGEQAVARYARGRHDVVFIDINMAGIDGLETLDRLLTIDPDIRIVLVAGDRTKQARAESATDQPCRVLHKPFFPADVDRVLHGLFAMTPPTFGENGHEAVYI